MNFLIVAVAIVAAVVFIVLGIRADIKSEAAQRAAHAAHIEKLHSIGNDIIKHCDEVTRHSNATTANLKKAADILALGR